MASITLNNATVDFPVFDGRSRSLKREVMNIATGGIIRSLADGGVTVRGLDSITLEIGHGERVGLVGHNGAGKTTMLRLLAGIYHPTSGECRIEGESFSLIDMALGIDPDAAGRENIRLRCAMMGITGARFRDFYSRIAEFSELGDFLDLPYRTYSTGMQTRLAFSISTILTPDILIMDEWLSTGDENFREKANRRLNELVDATNILVLASHSRDLLAINCSRVIWLEHGKVVMDGLADEVLAAYFDPPHRPPGSPGA